MFTIHELVAEFGITKRTIRRYVADGTLPPVTGRGPGAHYTHVHWDRLRQMERDRDGAMTRRDWHDRFNPETHLAALSAADLQRFQTTRRFTSGEWNLAVELWNAATPQEQRTRHTYCLVHGHDRVALPLDGATVCRRCLSYKVEEP